MSGTVFSKDKCTEALKLMLLCRYFENKTESLFTQGFIHGTTHLSTGQEAAEVGLCMALDEEDWIVPTHRCHGVTIAKGASVFSAFSEMLGSKHGLSKGLGGSMHMSDKAHCNLGSSAVVGSGVPMACGVAFYLKRIRSKNVSVAIFGDGATSRGSIHESMNLASIWKLPVLFFLENNLYGMSAKSTDMISLSPLYKRAQAYSMPGFSTDGNDIEAVYNAVSEALSLIRNGNGPVLLEVLTYRQKGHSKNDKRVYRSAEEEQEWLKRDPILLFENKLAENGILREEELRALKEECLCFIEKEAEQALSRKDERLSISEMEGLVFAKSVGEVQYDI